MSIASEIQRINTNIENAYSKVSEKGGTLPITQNSANLASSIDSIPTGGNTPDWTELGYATAPSIITEDFNYSKEVMQNWDVSETFNGDKEIVYLPSIDTYARTSFYQFFQSAQGLKYIKSLNVSKGRIFNYMFSNCVQLKSIPNLDVSQGYDFTYMFNSCSLLTNVPILNLEKATKLQNMYSYCPKLTNESLNNILASLLTATRYTGTKTLKYIGLSSTQATTCTTLSNWSALSQAGWTTGY